MSSKRKFLENESSSDSEYDSSESEEECQSKKINNDFEWRKCGGYEMIVMKKNGYINCTKMCYNICDKTGSKKPFKHWNTNANSKEVIKETAKITGIEKDELMIVIKGGQIPSITGTYCHPYLVTHIAYWLSLTFGARIGAWIDEWKSLSAGNERKYWTAIKNAETYKKSDKEKQIQTKLHAKYGGVIEVTTAYGRIDLLTNKYIIEIKTYDDWKCSIGQIIAYSREYPTKKRMIYLFDVPKKNILDKIHEICDEHNILLKTSAEK